jgi:hypothetical protein
MMFSLLSKKKICRRRKNIFAGRRVVGTVRVSESLSIFVGGQTAGCGVS